MNILVTGGTGFIGSKVVEEALSRGHAVAILVRNLKTVCADKVRVIQGSLRDCSWKDIQDFKPDLCIHCAWITTPGIYLESGENEGCYHDSLMFVRRLLEVGVNKIYALGTCFECQPSPFALSEDAHIAPQSFYAKCKSRLLMELENSLPREVVFGWLRIFYPYGEFEPKEKLITTAVYRFKSEQKFVLKSPHDLVDYIYVSDAASAILTACEASCRGCINIGSGIPRSVLDVVSLVAKTMNRTELVEWSSVNKKAPEGRVASLDKLTSIGWQPVHSLEKGICRIIDFNS